VVDGGLSYVMARRALRWGTVARGCQSPGSIRWNPVGPAPRQACIGLINKQ